MRPLREILKAFRSRPLSYWLGRDEPFTYEVKGARVFRVSRTHQTEIVVLSDIDQWTKRGPNLAIYKAQTISIIADPQNELGSVLEKHLPEKWLIEEEVNDRPGDFFLMAAARSGDLETLKLHEQRHGIIANRALAVLLVEYSVAYHQFHVAEWLLAQGADLNARDYLGKTPLGAAVYRGNTAGVKFLLGKGAAVDAPDGRKIAFSIVPLMLKWNPLFPSRICTITMCPRRTR